MNVYQISVGPRASNVPGPIASDRTFAIVTDTIQDAMNIARTKVMSNEEVTGIYEAYKDVIIDYIKVTGGN